MSNKTMDQFNDWLNDNWDDIAVQYANAHEKKVADWAYDVWLNGGAE